MNLDFTPEQEAIRDGIRELAAQFSDEYWTENDEAQRVSLGVLQRGGQGRLARPAFPRSTAAAGSASPRRRSSSRRSRHPAPGWAAAAPCTSAIFGFEPIIHHGSQDLKRRFLPRVVTGELHTHSRSPSRTPAPTPTNIRPPRGRSTAAGWSPARRCGSPRRWRPSGCCCCAAPARASQASQAHGRHDADVRRDGPQQGADPADPEDGPQRRRHQRTVHRRSVRGRRGRRG